MIDTDSGLVFVGSLDDDGDLVATAAIAASCAAFSRDDDDECYLQGDDPSCFNCRARRWVRGGFTCARGLLPR
ncbi:MAG: hypothetical protein WBI63_06625 [Coriobacteriia bacterium]